MDIDPGTGIDLDKPYDDPEMAAIREALLASGKKLQGSRLADGDMRNAATEHLRMQGNQKPAAINSMVEAMQSDPGLLDAIMSKSRGGLAPEAPASYMAAREAQDARRSSIPQAQMRNDNPATSPSGTEGPQGLPPPPNEAGPPQAPNNVQSAEGMGPWGPILAILGTLAAGGSAYYGTRALLNRRTAPPALNAPTNAPVGLRGAVPGDIDAGPGMRGAVPDDLGITQPRTMEGDDIMQMFAPRDAVEGDFAAPAAPAAVARAEPQTKGKPSKTTYKTNPAKIRAEHDAEVQDIETKAMKNTADKAARGNGKKPITNSPAFRENMADDARDRKAAAKAKEDAAKAKTAKKPVKKEPTGVKAARALARRGRK